MAIYGRDSLGRFVSKKKAQEIKELVERTRPSAKIVTFRERIRGTRIARTVKRAFQVEAKDENIRFQLEMQYDNGGNYVRNIIDISLGYMKPGDELEIERGFHGSADVSP